MSMALIGFALVLLLAFYGVPLGFSMLTLGVALFGLMRGWDPALSMMGQTIADLAANDGLSVLPMFILMGTFIYRADMAEELYEAANSLLGHFKGGLAYATVLASAGFAAISGSSIATAATMTRVAMPPMRARGYSDNMASGCVSSAGTLGALLPPSVPLLVYGIITQQDIGRLFIAGIIPGALLGLMFMSAIWWTVHRHPERGPAGERASWAQRLRALSKVWGVLVLFLLVVGGLYGGLFTATQAGSIGAFGSLLFALARRKLTLRIAFDALCEAAKTTGMIFTIIFGGKVFANMVSVSGLTGQLVESIQAMHLPAVGVVLVIVLIYIVLGSLMEGLSMMLLTVPVFMVVVQPLGINMIWFGVFVVMMMEIGLIHPPVGMNMFMVKTVMPDLSLRTIFIGTLPFLIANIITLALLIAVPSSTMWLERLLQ
ncbi:MAG TPA: TRAP transporter large permease [Eoetvoesiella sp.]|jgi:tripartite ATP-independent transporter DctM subunit|uniref:TRAP transporter large permease n=1 Tax=Eoetvoesiella sp. TaxID=1966355 RepID=UPI002CC5A468|nr:TRAP transporter large permease [Eoetvoesiella sp.]HWK60009.1 TRAP transporter large permease [Eoetvoesiella sp.]